MSLKNFPLSQCPSTQPMEFTNCVHADVSAAQLLVNGTGLQVAGVKETMAHGHGDLAHAQEQVAHGKLKVTGTR